MDGKAVARGEHESDRFWDVYSRYYDSVYHLMPYRKLLWDAYQALDLEPGMRLLDAGCGTGNFEHFLAEKDPPPVDIEAVDFSLGMLGVAQSKCRDLSNVTFRQADLNTELPYADATFDRIVSVNVLYALPERDQTMREFIRVLRPQGKLVITSPIPDFRWGPLVADHFRRVGNIWGASRKALTILDSIRVLSTTALGSFALNVAVINRRESTGAYHSLDEEEFRVFLEEHRKNGLGEYRIEPALARQNLFATAMKQTPALTA